MISCWATLGRTPLPLGLQWLPTSFWLRCPWDQNNPTLPGSWVRFAAAHEGQRVFTGVVDECEVSLSAAGRLLEVSGRGMAALLLDNEALGQDYQSATQADILQNHAAPYGIEAAPGASLPPVSRLSVPTGSSEWSVIYEFARYYGSQGRQTAYENIGERVQFGNQIAQIQDGVSISQVVQQKMLQQPTTYTTFIPSAGIDISWQPAQLDLDYQPTQLEFDWQTMKNTMEYVPGKYQMDILQYPKITVEYLGTPTYVPPSADPNYEEKSA